MINLVLNFGNIQDNKDEAADMNNDGVTGNREKIGNISAVAGTDIDEKEAKSTNMVATQEKVNKLTPSAQPEEENKQAPSEKETKPTTFAQLHNKNKPTEPGRTENINEPKETKNKPTATATKLGPPDSNKNEANTPDQAEQDSKPALAAQPEKENEPRGAAWLYGAPVEQNAPVS